MESINLTLVVGLSVDYAVHLADGYVRCEYSDRTRRVKHMLGNVGVSVLAGAATTLGASAFMLGSRILFFFQFGIFIFCTIGFSIVYALIVFTIVIGLIGPEGDKGNILYILDYFKRKKPVPPNNSSSSNRDSCSAELVLNAESLGDSTPMKETADDIEFKDSPIHLADEDGEVVVSDKVERSEKDKLMCETKQIWYYNIIFTLYRRGKRVD